jgi:hypothetical protein
VRLDLLFGGGIAPGHWQRGGDQHRRLALQSGVLRAHLNQRLVHRAVRLQAAVGHLAVAQRQALSGRAADVVAAADVRGQVFRLAREAGVIGWTCQGAITAG